jgi:hypothetical protein
VADRLDQLTNTFQLDRAFCDALFESPYRTQAAELILSHLWANNAFLICHKALARAAPARFGPGRDDKAAVWTLILIESLQWDLRLVPYLVVRGLPSEAAVALRRAMEHTGVLAHIWRDTAKVDALDDPASADYSNAFRRQRDAMFARFLKDAGLAKRFSAMRAAVAATALYDQLSTFHVHGGTRYRLLARDLSPNELTCSFCNRPVPSSGHLGQQLAVLTDGHKLMCGELMGLCADYSEPFDELVDAAKALSILLSQDGTQSTELRSAVRNLLARLQDAGDDQVD